MSKKNLFADQVWQLANKAKESRDENEKRFLKAITDGDLNTINVMHLAHQTPGVLLTPKEQVIRYIQLAAETGANADVFQQLFAIYPKTLNERLLLETEQYIGLNDEGRKIYGDKDFFDMGCERYEGDKDREEHNRANQSIPSGSRYPEYKYINETYEQNKSCFNIALETSIDCARALIDALKAVTGFQYLEMLTKKENILDAVPSSRHGM